MRRFVIAPGFSERDRAAIVALLRGYEAGLGVSLCFQDFEAEVAGLPGDYAPPRGQMLLARDTRREGLVVPPPLAAISVGELLNQNYTGIIESQRPFESEARNKALASMVCELRIRDTSPARVRTLGANVSGFMRRAGLG